MLVFYEIEKLRTEMKHKPEIFAAVDTREDLAAPTFEVVFLDLILLHRVSTRTTRKYHHCVWKWNKHALNHMRGMFAMKRLRLLLAYTIVQDNSPKGQMIILLRPTYD